MQHQTKKLEILYLFFTAKYFKQGIILCKDTRNKNIHTLPTPYTLFPTGFSCFSCIITIVEVQCLERS